MKPPYTRLFTRASCLANCGHAVKPHRLHEREHDAQLCVRADAFQRYRAEARLNMTLGVLMSIGIRTLARTLAIAALVLWICSLFFTGIALHAEQRSLPGYEILAMGWLSPLALNFAWFANIFFLYGIFALLSGRTPITASILAVVFSLDTFRFGAFLLNEGGATTPVYGYGWGAVLWFVSMCLMLTAVGARRREIGNMHEWFQPLGLTILALMLGFVSYFAFNDRAIANSTEAQRLAGIAFKRGGVCSAPEPIVREPIKNLSGSLQVVIQKDALYARHPFEQIKQLLDWGIPSVRIGNVDYSLDVTDPKAMKMAAANDTAAATLYVTEVYLNAISAKLVETSTKRTVFDQTWTREDYPVNTNIYCPDYHSFPRADEQPRRLVMEALDHQAPRTSVPSTRAQ